MVYFTMIEVEGHMYETTISRRLVLYYHQVQSSYSADVRTKFEEVDQKLNKTAFYLDVVYKSNFTKPFEDQLRFFKIQLLCQLHVNSQSKKTKDLSLKKLRLIDRY